MVHLRGAQHVFSVGRKEPIEFHVELHVLTIGARHLGVFPFARIMMAVNLQNISKYLVYRPCLSLWLRFQEMTWCQLTSWKRRPEESLNLQGLHNNIYIYKSVILNVCIHTTFHSYLHHALLIFEKATNSILCNFLFLLLCAEPPALPVAPHAEFRSG